MAIKFELSLVITFMAFYDCVRILPCTPCRMQHANQQTDEQEDDTNAHLFSCPQIHTTLKALDLWRDPSSEAALLDDWREKLAASPHKATETDSPQ